MHPTVPRHPDNLEVNLEFKIFILLLVQVTLYLGITQIRDRKRPLYLVGAGRNDGTSSSCTDGEDGVGEINDDDDFLEDLLGDYSTSHPR